MYKAKFRTCDPAERDVHGNVIRYVSLPWSEDNCIRRWFYKLLVPAERNREQMQMDGRYTPIHCMNSESEIRS